MKTASLSWTWIRNTPLSIFRYSGNKTCEVALELNRARGAVWVGDVVCSGLSSWAAVTQTGEENES